MRLVFSTVFRKPNGDKAFLTECFSEKGRHTLEKYADEHAKYFKDKKDFNPINEKIYAYCRSYKRLEALSSDMWIGSIVEIPVISRELLFSRFKTAAIKKDPDASVEDVTCEFFDNRGRAESSAQYDRTSPSTKKFVDVSWSPLVATTGSSKSVAETNSRKNTEAGRTANKNTNQSNSPGKDSGLQVVADKPKKQAAKPVASGEDSEAYAKRKNAEYAIMEKERKAANEKLMQELAKPAPKCNPCGTTRQ